MLHSTLQISFSKLMCTFVPTSKQRVWLYGCCKIAAANVAGAAAMCMVPRVPCAAQECWEMMYDSVDTLHDCVRIATGVLSTLKIRPERMLRGACSSAWLSGHVTAASALDWIISTNLQSRFDALLPPLCLQS